MARRNSHTHQPQFVLCIVHVCMLPVPCPPALFRAFIKAISYFSLSVGVITRIATKSISNSRFGIRNIYARFSFRVVFYSTNVDNQIGARSKKDRDSGRIKSIYCIVVSPQIDERGLLPLLRKLVCPPQQLPLGSAKSLSLDTIISKFHLCVNT